MKFIIFSIAGFESYPGGSIYCASKFAVRAITEALRREVVGTPIRVSAVNPGIYLFYKIFIIL